MDFFLNFYDVCLRSERQNSVITVFANSCVILTVILVHNLLRGVFTISLRKNIHLKL